jgi:hypothetical protein
MSLNKGMMSLNFDEFKFFSWVRSNWLIAVANTLPLLNV